MSEFSKTMMDWIDEDELIGSSIHPGKWSTGNPQLETVICIAYEITLEGRGADIDFLRLLIGGLSGTERDPGIFDKNPGRKDEITHDDVKALACTQHIASTMFATELVNRGEVNGWFLGNTDYAYWDMIAKPWDVAFYKFAASRTPALYQALSLIFLILMEALMAALKRSNPSNHRLTWLCLLAIKECHPVLRLSAKLWSKAMAKLYGNVGNMMEQYYKNPNHPYAVFGQKILF